jgi:hypothetical protein
VVASWLAPALIILSVLLLGRAFYVLYVQRRGNRTSKILVWMSAVFVIGFWTWRLLGGRGAHVISFFDSMGLRI